MQILGVPGTFQKLGRYAHKLKNAINIDKLSEVAKYRLKIVVHGRTYGYKSAMHAFNISKSSYYEYCRLHDSGKLEPKSKRPKSFKVSAWNKSIVRFIKQIRATHPNLGKGKIKYYLDDHCLNHGIATISTGTIQNIINSFPNKLRFKRSVLTRSRSSNVIRKPAKYKASMPGECTSLDTMEFRRNGKKAYVVTAIDEATNLLFAKATMSHTSKSAILILKNAYAYLPWDDSNIVLTDNGCEFALDFDKYLKTNGITHYRTYPKTPKMNARCERANKTIQDEFIIKYGSLLFTDIDRFNKKLKQYLHWHNMKRVNARFGNKMTPFQKMRELILANTIPYVPNGTRDTNERM